MSNMYDKSFYAFIPHWLQDKLTMKALLFGKEKWFEEAWAVYANYCKSMPARQIPDVDKFFEDAQESAEGKTMYAVSNEPTLNFAEEEDSADILMAAEELEEVKPSEEFSGSNRFDSISNLEINKRHISKHKE